MYADVLVASFTFAGVFALLRWLKGIRAKDAGKRYPPSLSVLQLFRSILGGGISVLPEFFMRTAEKFGPIFSINVAGRYEESSSSISISSSLRLDLLTGSGSLTTYPNICGTYCTGFHSHSASLTGSRPWCGDACQAGRPHIYICVCVCACVCVHVYIYIYKYIYICLHVCTKGMYAYVNK